MAGFLTTHVLDTARGKPAEGLRIVLYRIEDGERRVVLSDLQTNSDGRTDTQILPEHLFQHGTYELHFHAGSYLRTQGISSSFLDLVPIRFEVSEDAHYHVPLLLSPYGYSTYRGS